MELLNVKFNESFEVEVKGEKVRVTVLRNKDNPEEFVFGFDAPAHISITPEEVLLKAVKAEMNL